MEKSTAVDILYWSLVIGLSNFLYFHYGYGLTTLGLGTVLYIGLAESWSFILFSSLGGSILAAIGFMVLPGLFSPGLVLWVRLITIPLSGLAICLARRMDGIIKKGMILFVLGSCFAFARRGAGVQWRFWPWLILLGVLTTFVFTWPRLANKGNWYDGLFSLTVYWLTSSVLTWVISATGNDTTVEKILYEVMWQPMAADIILLNIVCLIRDRTGSERRSLWEQRPKS